MSRFRPLLCACALAASLSGLGAGPAWAAQKPAQPAERKTTQSESYVVIEPIYASILDGTRPRGLLLVEFGLDVPDAGLRERVNQGLPALRDAYVRALLTYAATAVRPWRQPNVEDISKRMQAITDRSLGKTGARVLMAQTAIRLTR
jgi:flagellar basal body-associated protein FliL